LRCDSSSLLLLRLLLVSSLPFCFLLGVRC
jgi:hypothetical protein